MNSFTHTVVVPTSVSCVRDKVMDMFRWLQDDTDVRWTAKRTPRHSRVTGKLLDTTVTFSVNSRDTLDPVDHDRVRRILDHLQGWRDK